MNYKEASWNYLSNVHIQPDYIDSLSSKTTHEPLTWMLTEIWFVVVVVVFKTEECINAMRAATSVLSQADIVNCVSAWDWKRYLPEFHVAQIWTVSRKMSDEMWASGSWLFPLHSSNPFQTPSEAHYTLKCICCMTADLSAPSRTGGPHRWCTLWPQSLAVGRHTHSEHVNTWHQSECQEVLHSLRE